MSARRTIEFLDGNKVNYVTFPHAAANSAQEVAASTHVPGRHMAKTVVVRLDDKLALAVVPANRMLDLARLREESGADDVRLAEEAEFIDRFEGCQLGAMPPFGNLFGIETYVDRALARDDCIVFNAGSHTEAIGMTFSDYRHLARPKIAQIATGVCHLGAVHALQV